MEMTITRYTPTSDLAGLAEWQTLMSQTHLSERACGFESRTRHTNKRMFTFS